MGLIGVSESSFVLQGISSNFFWLYLTLLERVSLVDFIGGTLSFFSKSESGFFGLI